ncbi:hypothetical protein BH23ACT10_BH23ACT10_26590 [soil metagenome]
MAVDGIDVLLTPDMYVALADRTTGWRRGAHQLVRTSRYVRAGDVPAITRDYRSALVVARRISVPARARLTDDAIAWALDDGRYAIDGHTRNDPVGAPSAVERHDHLGALALLLVDDDHRSQRALADALGVSQPLVHRLLRRLPADPGGVDRRGVMLEVWSRRRHRPQPERQHWIADIPVWEQVALAVQRLDGGGHEPVVGGECAADMHAPWTTPATAVIHARGLRPLGHPFIPTVDADEATLTVEATRDPLVHALAKPATTPVGPLPLAHPAIAARDLEPLADTDERVAEALGRLRRQLQPHGEHRALR